MGFRHHNEIDAWQRADALRRRWAEILKREQVSRDFDFCVQTRKAARSACRNTAEGFWKFSHPEFARYLDIVQGSLGELLDSADDALACGYVDQQERDALTADTEAALKSARAF